MAIASQSLFNMTVAGDNSGGNQGLLMPKLQFRFRVNFINLGLGNDGLSLTKQVMECQRPNLSFDEITLNVYNSRIYLAGKHTWQELTMTIRDDASGTVGQAIGDQLQKQMNFVEQASAAAGQDYKFETNIQILDGGNGAYAPVVLEEWQLYGCFLKSANYQTLNYATSEAVTIQLAMRYDNAVQLLNGSLQGLGNPAVARNSAIAQDSATGIGTSGG
jgi:hypothetical protein